jgi:hypothetical protein
MKLIDHHFNYFLKMKKIFLSNSGLIVNDNNISLNNVKFNFGFISSATSSMVNDIPDHSEIRKDVHNIKIADSEINMCLDIPMFCVKWIIRKNKNSINEYLKSLNKYSDGYSIDLKEFNITNVSKCGAQFHDGQLKQIRLMPLKETHFEQFDRDFLGFFLNINFKGKITFKNNKADIEHINFIFTRIPLLCFKSENAIKNNFKKNISIEMLKKFSGRKEINSMFI